MGADYRAHTILGIKISRQFLESKVRTKAFPHDYPEDYDFCPKTAKPLWIIKPGYEISELESLINKRGYTITSEDCDSTFYYIGYKLGEVQGEDGVRTSFYDPKILENLEQYKRKLSIDLSKLGIWDENKFPFGIWTVMEVSV